MNKELVMKNLKGVEFLEQNLEEVILFQTEDYGFKYDDITTVIEETQQENVYKVSKDNDSFHLKIKTIEDEEYPEDNVLKIVECY